MSRVPTPIPLVRLKGALDAAGAAPLKRHGQHFMIDPNLLAAVAAAGEAGPDDVVLEVGPGPGLLTRHLLSAGSRVVAVEIDPRMEDVARELMGPEGRERLTWVHADALAGARALSPAMEAALPERARVVANLPYHIASPLLANLLVHPRAPLRMAVTVQREAADRLLARPGTRDYGPLSVLVALCSRARRLRAIPPAAFWPRPRVDSALVVLDRRADRPAPEALVALAAFLPAAFHARRKTLVNSLAESAGRPSAEVQATLALPENSRNLRAEALEPVQLCALALRWAASAASGRNRS